MVPEIQFGSGEGPGATRTGNSGVSHGEINGLGVRLRAYRPDDAEQLAQGYDDPESHRFLPPLPSPFTVAHAERFLAERVPSIFAEGGAL